MTPVDDAGAEVATADGVVERFVILDCAGDACVGILSRPSVAAARTTAVLVIVGGPQYRVGSHRQFVSLARALARAGFPTLRADYRGMGDSDGAARTFESIDDDLACAIEALKRETGAARVVLWGLCDGASAALMGAVRAPLVCAIVAVNPWARSPGGEAATRLRHYYLQRLFSKAFWAKLLRGDFDARRGAADLANTVRTAPQAGDAGRPAFLSRMHDGWLAFRRPLLLVLSGRDLTAREFEAWVAADPGRRRQLAACTVHPLPEADHTTSTRAARLALERATIEWLQRIDA